VHIQPDSDTLRTVLIYFLNSNLVIRQAETQQLAGCNSKNEGAVLPAGFVKSACGPKTKEAAVVSPVKLRSQGPKATITNDGVTAQQKHRKLIFWSFFTAIWNCILSIFGIVTNPSTEAPTGAPSPTVPRSCAAHLAVGSTTNGVYNIDPDGDGGPIAPFDVYCDQTTRGGGWTLFAYVEDGAPVATMVTPVLTGEVGVLPDEAWTAVRDNMESGMLFVDENQAVSRMSKVNLEQASCLTPWNITSLWPATTSPIFSLFHEEKSGCSITGQDYCLAIMRRNVPGSTDMFAVCVFEFWEEWGYGNAGWTSAHNTMSYFVR